MEPKNEPSKTPTEPSAELTTEQAAQELGIQAQSVRKLIYSGRLKANHHETPNKIGYWTIPAANLDAVRDRPTGWKKGRSRSAATPAQEPEK